MKNNNSSFKSKMFRAGGYSTLISVAAIAIVIVINLIISSLPAIYTRYDTSSTAMFSIGEETMDIVGAIGEDVTIYLVAENGAEDDTLVELLGRYTSLNKRITVKRIDPATNPNFTGNYTEETLSPSSLIIESARRFFVVDYADIFVTNYSEEELMNYYYYGIEPSGTTSFAGESKITSALQYVTSDYIPTLYILGGHGETALDETLMTYITEDNYNTAALDLLTVEAIPADASALIINAPTNDISATEMEKINAYVKTGGTVIMLTAYSDEPLNNLYALPASYGVNIVPGMLIEGNANYYMSGYPYFIMPKIQNSEISAMMGSNLRVLLPYAQGLTVGNKPSGVTVTSLLSSSGAAYSKLDAMNITSLEKEDGDQVGPFDLGVLIEDSATGAKIVWVTSTELLNSQVDSLYVSGGNSTFFLSTLSYLCEKGVSVSIAAKSMQVEALVVSEMAANLWSIVIIAIIPLGTIALGLYIWAKRRKQ